jgi:multicomponent Na+:H+ antiporter subunit B
MKGMSVIVKTVTRLLMGFIFVYGIYIVLHGHLTPGGGFAGGAIIGSAFALFILAQGSTEGSEKKTFFKLSMFESSGALMFLCIALLGLLFGFFFKNFLPHGHPLTLWSAGIIPLANIAIGLKVAAALFSIFMALAVAKYTLED